MTPTARKIVALALLVAVAIALWVRNVTKRRQEIRNTEAATAEALQRYAIESREKDARRAATALPQPAATPSRVTGVEPDCYADGLVCDRSRVKDAERLARTLEPTLNSSGWPIACFLVQYISGDDSEPGAISIGVSGPRGAGSSGCHDQPTRRVDRADLARLAKNIKQALAAHAELLRDIDLLQVTDGAGGEVQIQIP